MARKVAPTNVASPAADGSSQSIEAEIQPAIHDLPPAKREHIVSIVQQIVEHHSGPLPLPRTLADYDAILPGLAERIVSMSERDMVHNQGLQNSALRAEIAERKTGQLGAIVVTLAALGSAAWMVVSGHPWPGGLLGGGTLLGVVTVLVGGRDYLLSRIGRTTVPDKPNPASGARKKRR